MSQQLASFNNDLYIEQNRLILSIISIVMPRTAAPLTPRVSRLLEQIGANIKLARLRRQFSAATVAQRAGLSRNTLQRVEQGDGAVSLGTYARVLQVLRLEQDLTSIAANDELGRKLQDAGVLPGQRAPKRQAEPGHIDNADDDGEGFV